MIDETLTSLFLEATRNYSERIFCSTYDHNNSTIIKNITYHQLEQLVMRQAQELKKDSNIKLMGLHLENSPEWIIYFFAAMFAGVNVVIFDSRLELSHLTLQLQDAQPQILISNKEPNELKKFNIKIIPSDINLNNLNSKIYPITHPSSDSTAVIIYTSGSTGRPRGVEFTQKALFHATINTQLVFPHLYETTILALIPYSHIYGLISVFLVPLFSGCKLFFINTFKPKELLAALRICNIYSFCGTPVFFESIYKNILNTINSFPPLKRKFILNLLQISFKLSLIIPRIWYPFAKILFKRIRIKLGKNLTTVVSGGARLNPSVTVGLFAMGFFIHEGYGLTETAGCICVSNKIPLQPGSVGKPFKNVQIKIVDPDEKGIGEVYVKSNQLMKCYYKNPEMTSEVFEDGWFKTGDMGKLDKSGSLFLSGRNKNIIVTSAGKKVYPEDIEMHLNNISGVKEVCSFGIVMDGSMNEQIASVVVIDSINALSTQNIVKNKNKELPSYCQVQYFSFITEELPKMKNYKIDRKKVIENYKKYFAQLS